MVRVLVWLSAGDYLRQRAAILILMALLFKLIAEKRYSMLEYKSYDFICGKLCYDSSTNAQYIILVLVS